MTSSQLTSKKKSKIQQANGLQKTKGTSTSLESDTNISKSQQQQYEAESSCEVSNNLVILQHPPAAENVPTNSTSNLISPRKVNSARCSITLLNSPTTDSNELFHSYQSSKQQLLESASQNSLQQPQEQQQQQQLRRRKTSKSHSNTGKNNQYSTETYTPSNEPKTVPNTKSMTQSDPCATFETYCDQLGSNESPSTNGSQATGFFHISQTTPNLPAPMTSSATYLANNNSSNNSQQNLGGSSSPQIPVLPSPQLSRQQSSLEDKQNEGSFDIFRCPIVLEKYNVKLWIVYFDNLIEVLFKTPVDAIRVIFCYLFLNQRIAREHYSVFLHVALTYVPFILFSSYRFFPASNTSSPASSSSSSSLIPSEYFEVAYWYHALRGQSTLKLYGVLMTADIIDKMLCTVGEFLILDVLWQKLSMQKLSVFTVVKYFLPTIVYVCLHSIVLFLSIIGYNVILNSDISSLFVLIFVHNSMKLKSSVFKKFTKDAYTQQTHEDLRARFSKFFTVFLIWASGRGFSADILRKLIYFLGSEIIIEWIKHIFLMLLNNLKLSIIENMNKACKVFVAQVRIIPAFMPQEIVNHKAVQTFQERENYLAQTPHVPPSLKVGFRVNFLPFHHAIVLLKIMHPHAINYFSIEMACFVVLALRVFQFCNDLLILKYSFSNSEILKLYQLNHNTNLLTTLLNKMDIIIVCIALAALASLNSEYILTTWNAYFPATPSE